MGLVSGIRDPGSGKNLFRIPDLGFKKAPDPDPQRWLRLVLRIHDILVWTRKDKKSKRSHKTVGIKIFLSILLDDIRIHTSDLWVWIRIQEAQINSDPDPQHWFSGFRSGSGSGGFGIS
jgi:hypothetical protein